MPAGLQSKHRVSAVSFAAQLSAKWVTRKKTKWNRVLPTTRFQNYKTTNLGGVSALSVSRTKPPHERLVGGLPGAGWGVDGGRPLLAVLPGRVIHSVAGQQGEDEVRRLGAEVCLSFHLTRLPHLTEPLIIHAYRRRNFFFFLGWKTKTFCLPPESVGGRRFVSKLMWFNSYGLCNTLSMGNAFILQQRLLPLPKLHAVFLPGRGI